MTRKQKIASLKQEIKEFKLSRLTVEDVEDVSDNYQAHLEYGYWKEEIEEKIKRLENMTDSEYGLRYVSPEVG